MKIAKTFGIATFASLALMAGVGAATALALQVRSCENNTLSSCKKASTSTTFRAEGISVDFSNGFFSNDCIGRLGGTVTDPESLSGADPIASSLTSASFSVCNLGQVHVIGLPWTLETNTVEFPWGKVTGAHLKMTIPFVGTCTFAEDFTHTISATWSNGSGSSKSSVTLGGTMAKTEGGSGCGSNVSVSGPLSLFTVSDPGNAKANNLRIE